MPDWLIATCSTTTISTMLIVVAVVMYLPNLYFNSNSTVFRKKENIESENTGKGIEFTRAGVLVNSLIAIVSIFGIYLTFKGC